MPLCAHKNRLIETVLLSTKNIRSGSEIRKLIIFTLLSEGLSQAFLSKKKLYHLKKKILVLPVLIQSEQISLFNHKDDVQSLIGQLIL